MRPDLDPEEQHRYGEDDLDRERASEDTGGAAAAEEVVIGERLPGSTSAIAVAIATVDVGAAGDIVFRRIRGAGEDATHRHALLVQDLSDAPLLNIFHNQLRKLYLLFSCLFAYSVLGRRKYWASMAATIWEIF